MCNRCSLCGISYPTHILKCRKCGGSLSSIQAAVDSDWDEQSRDTVFVADPERERLITWRASCLYDAGLRDLEAATLLSGTDIDLHKACDMVRAGCDPKLLLEILL